MQKSIKNLLHLGIDFWEDFGGFWKAKWSQVGIKIDQKSIKNLCKNRSFLLMPLGVDLWTKFADFWCQNEAKLGPKWDQKSMWTSNGEFSKNLVFPKENNVFWHQMGPSWEPKPTKNRSKNGVQDGWHLGIDFSWILIDFGRQVGRETGAKIDPKRHRKTMRKRRAARLPKKSQ